MDFFYVLSSFGSVIFTVLAFVVALSIIVTVHEYGHYIVGRWCGIRADVFSLGMGPNLASFVDRHGTRWQIAAFPVGGYVKFAGDGDAASALPENFGQDNAPPPERHTMLGAPLWARALTILAGPVFNFILAALIFTCIALWQGQVREPLAIRALHPAVNMELYGGENTLRAGDHILSMNGHGASDLSAHSKAVSKVRDSVDVLYEIMRDGQKLELIGPNPILPVVASVQPRSAADDAGIRVGDVVLEADGVEIKAFAQLVEVKDRALQNPIALRLQRGDSQLKVDVAPRRVDLPLADGGFETRNLIGVTGAMLLEYETESFGVIEAVRFSLERVWGQIQTTVSGVSHMITGAISSCNLSGPVGIAEASGSVAQQGVLSFILFIASLSIAIGFLNLLPVPVLDGGHLVLFAYEAVVGRAPSETWMKGVIAVGLSIVGTLFVFGLLNDLFLCP